MGSKFSIDFRRAKMSQLPPFHLAFAVDDLEAARRFYGDVLGCPEGRRSETWIDFNLFGHQIVAHLIEGTENSGRHDGGNLVDGHSVPVPHFGVVLPPSEWKALATRLKQAGVGFVIEPHVRFEG
jgi:extradiol dioxygenase family protein